MYIASQHVPFFLCLVLSFPSLSLFSLPPPSLFLPFSLSFPSLLPPYSLPTPSYFSLFSFPFPSLFPASSLPTPSYFSLFSLPFPSLFPPFSLLFLPFPSRFPPFLSLFLHHTSLISIRSLLMQRQVSHSLYSSSPKFKVFLFF